MVERIEQLWREAAYGVRLLVKNPMHTMIVGTTLALGIGATTAIFSVLYATILAPLPFADSQKLVWVDQRNAEGRGRGLPKNRVEDWKRTTRTLDGVAFGLLGFVSFTVQGPNGAERIWLEQVDYQTLNILGIKPILGRWFEPDEVIVQGDTSRSIIISYGLWQRAFGGDPNVLGKKMPGWTAGWGDTVIGVMPKGFYTHPERSNADGWYVTTSTGGGAIGRLKPGVTVEQARAELAGLGLNNAPNPGTNVQNTFSLRVIPLHNFYRDGYTRTVYLLLGAVMFVLLIASVNVANLQLNRSVRRQPEIAARIALGAGRWRLLRQLIVENLVLTLFGGVLGVLVSFAGIWLFVFLAPSFYPPTEEIVVNGPVLLFTFGVCLVTGILSGLVPGLRGSNPNLSATLKEGGRGIVGRSRLGVRRVLVVSEIALAMVLLVGAGLMITSYARLTSVDVGLDSTNVLTFQVSTFGMDKYRIRRTPLHWSATPEISRFYAAALERLALLPGVQAVAATSNLPPRGGVVVPFDILGKPNAGGGDRPDAAFHEVSTSFFDAMKIPVRGRKFTDLDRETSPGVVIVSETLAKQYFGNENPIGQSIQVQMHNQNPSLTPDRVREIVGVARDVRMSFRSEFEPILYVPDRQNLTDYESNGHLGIHAIHDFVVRTSASGKPTDLVPLVKRAFADVDPNIVVSDIMPMRERLIQVAGAQEFWMRLLGIFAGLGMFLAAIGVYGVISYAVEQRTHEFGIRTTFGASRFDILQLILREGVIVIVLGLTIGIGGAYAATRLIEKQLFGVTRMDPMTIASVAVVLVVVAFLACYIPGRRATKLDPLTALRTE